MFRLNQIGLREGKKSDNYPKARHTSLRDLDIGMSSHFVNPETDAEEEDDGLPDEIGTSMRPDDDE